MKCLANAPQKLKGRTAANQRDAQPVKPVARDTHVKEDHYQQR